MGFPPWLYTEGFLPECLSVHKSVLGSRASYCTLSLQLYWLTAVSLLLCPLACPSSLIGRKQPSLLYGSWFPVSLTGYHCASFCRPPLRWSRDGLPDGIGEGQCLSGDYLFVLGLTGERSAAPNVTLLKLGLTLFHYLQAPNKSKWPITTFVI